MNRNRFSHARCVPQRRRRRDRRGASVVEFALVAPVFFMLMIGIIEVGRALMVQQILINASRVGARQAVLLNSSSSAVSSAVSSYASGVGLNGVSTSVTPDPGSAAAGTSITVTTSIDFSGVSWIPSPWFMGGKTITASSVMRKEGF